MKRILLLFCVTSVIVGTVTAQDNNIERQNYIDNYKELAMREMQRTGVPASITLAQGILESKSGKSSLAQYSNNHFGIKCKAEWTGDKVYQDDDARGECFRVYQSPEESFKDHSDFLKNRPYYTSLFDLDPTDYKGWANGLKKAGYATERNYANMLITLIEKYKLEDYSDIALARMSNPQNSNTELVSIASVANQEVAVAETKEVVPAKETPSTTTIQSVAHTNAVKETSVQSSAYPTSIFKINNTNVLFAQSGASLLAIATNCNISYSKLLSYNDLPDLTILPMPRLIFLAKRPKKGQTEVHVAQNESLDEIAQKEGVQLTSLVQYNRVAPGEKLLDGERVYLKDRAPQSPRTSLNTIARIP